MSCSGRVGREMEGIDRTHKKKNLKDTLLIRVYFLPSSSSCNIWWPRITQHFLGGITRFFLFFLLPLTANSRCYCLYLSRAILRSSPLLKPPSCTAVVYKYRLGGYFVCCHPIFGFLLFLPPPFFHPVVLRRNVGRVIDRENTWIADDDDDDFMMCHCWPLLFFKKRKEIQ